MSSILEPVFLLLCKVFGTCPARPKARPMLISANSIYIPLPSAIIIDLFVCPLNQFQFKMPKVPIIPIMFVFASFLLCKAFTSKMCTGTQVTVIILQPPTWVWSIFVLHHTILYIHALFSKMYEWMTNIQTPGQYFPTI